MKTASKLKLHDEEVWFGLIDRATSNPFKTDEEQIQIFTELLRKKRESKEAVEKEFPGFIDFLSRKRKTR